MPVWNHSIRQSCRVLHAFVLLPHPRRASVLPVVLNGSWGVWALRSAGFELVGPSHMQAATAVDWSLLVCYSFIWIACESPASIRSLHSSKRLQDSRRPFESRASPMQKISESAGTAGNCWYWRCNVRPMRRKMKLMGSDEQKVRFNPHLLRIIWTADGICPLTQDYKSASVLPPKASWHDTGAADHASAGHSQSFWSRVASCLT